MARYRIPAALPTTTTLKDDQGSKITRLEK
jgi:hypothetical protein